MRYSTVLWDADETLLDFFRTEEQSLRNAFSEMNLPYSAETHPIYHEINDGLWLAFSKGRLDKATLTVRRFELLFAKLGLEADPVRFKEHYEGWIARGFFTVPGAVEVLARLKAEGFSLHCVTNGLKATQESRLTGAGLIGFFEHLFISEEAGSQKPQRAYFDYVFARVAEKDPKRIVLVGDSLFNDVGGGRAAGLDTVWYNPKGLPGGDEAPTHTISRLEEIFAIVE